jgi:hypothetical protein
MLINPKLEMSVRGSINKSHPMSFPRFKDKLRVLPQCAIEFISPVDETVICRRRWTRDLFCKVLLKCSSME